MRTSISELSRLSPELRSVAMAVCEEGGLALSSPIQTPNVNQLQVNSKLWAQHVQVISTTIDDFIVPWAATAMKLAKMALSEKGSVEAKVLLHSTVYVLALLMMPKKRLESVRFNCC